ncbi:c-type cytochrome [Luteimonas sp. 22616]|uniref:c-type cytochrome n=1 Tax=Luteimonas sp. 22616 TaxID=3453951 RepID=UPI003F86710D
MRHARAYGFAGLAAFAVAAAAFAQTTVTPLPDNAPVETASLDTSAVAELAKTKWGDPQAGATKAGACAACHGLDGNPTDPMYPRMAGQSERYIAHQLALFKSGERNTGMAAVMMPFASMLSAQDMRDIGAYFATQKAGAGIADDTLITSGPNQGMKFYQVGQKLFRSGDMARGIPACMACHGPAGAGNPGPAYPHIGGQQADYVVRRLQEYRAGTTSEADPHLFNMMATIAKSLTDEEISSLGSYLQGLHERPDAATQAAMARAPQAPAAAPVPAPAPAESAPTPEAEPAAQPEQS